MAKSKIKPQIVSQKIILLQYCESNLKLAVLRALFTGTFRESGMEGKKGAQASGTTATLRGL